MTIQETISPEPQKRGEPTYKFKDEMRERERERERERVKKNPLA